jgi:hypothetical protein
MTKDFHFKLLFSPWVSGCPFYLGQRVQAYAAIAGQVDPQTGAVYCAEELRAIAGVTEHYTFDEAKQALMYDGPLTAEMLPEGFMPARKPTLARRIVRWVTRG